MVRYRTWLSALLSLLIAIVFIAPSCLADTPADYDKNLPMLLSEGHLNAQAAVLMDGVTGEVLFQKNASTRMYPASTTKVMTLMLALESGISLDLPVIIPQQASQIPADSTLVPVFPRDQLTFRDLLYGFMLSSGNDGANAVAVLVSGSLEAFVQRMNDRAAELGCKNTHFSNAHGYHDADHYTTAEDLALITREALKSGIFRSIVGCRQYTLTIQRDGGTVTPRVVNTNLMLRDDSTYFYKDCIGVKTGTHSRAGNCFVGAAERDGIQLISVVLRCPQSNQKWVDTRRLFDYGYTRYTAYTLDQMFGFARDRIATVKVSNAIESDPKGGALDLDIAQVSNQEYIRMVASDNEQAMEDAISDFVTRSMLTITHNMVAPVSEGEVVGQFRYVAQSGEEITALLIAGRSIEAQPPRFTLTDFFPFLQRLEDPLVQALLIAAAALIVLLILAGILRRASRQKRRSEIYEVRKREKLRDDRSRTQRRLEARRRSRERFDGRRKRYDHYFDDDDDDDLTFDGYDEEDDGSGDPDRDPYDEYDEYDDYDDYDDQGVRRIRNRK